MRVGLMSALSTQDVREAYQLLLEVLRRHLVVYGVGRDLDISGSALLQHILDDVIERVGPARLGRLDAAQDGLRAGKRLGHLVEGVEGRFGVERVVQQRLVRLQGGRWSSDDVQDG